MGFLLGLIVWTLVSVATDSVALGLVIGAITVFLSHQQGQIARLSKRLDALQGLTPEPLATSDPQALKPADAPVLLSSSAPRPKIVARNDPSPQPVPPSELQERPPTSPTIPAMATQETEPSPKAHEEKVTSPRLEDFVGPSIAQAIFQANTIARVGVALLFIGVAFALKFAADQGLFPVELRLILAVMGGGLLLGLGLRMRHSKRQFGLALQGGGLGVLYITTFVAFRVYSFIPASVASVTLIVLTIYTAILATHQNAKALAFLSLVGGFSAPLLTSTGGGDPRSLLAYLAILNAGILAMCVSRGWGSINVLGFVSTVLVGGIPASLGYSSSQFSSYQLFLILFIALFTTNTYLLARKDALKDFVAAVMTFAPPFIGFIFQYKMVEGLEYGTAVSCVGFGAFYTAVGWLLRSRRKDEMNTLIDAYLAIGISLLSLAIPFAVSGRVTSAIWAAEGVGLLWSGLRHRHWFSRALGLTLLMVATPLFISDKPFRFGGLWILNTDVFGALILVLSYLVASKLLVDSERREGAGSGNPMAGLCGFIGAAWWTVGGLAEILRHIDTWEFLFYPFAFKHTGPFYMTACGVFLHVTALIMWEIRRRWRLPGLELARVVPLTVLCLSAMTLIVKSIGPASFSVHPFMHYSAIGWICGFMAHYFILKGEDEDCSESRTGSHSISLWLLIFLATWEARWIIASLLPTGPAWGLSMVSIVPALAVLGVVKACRPPRFWPFQRHSAVYLNALHPLGILLVIYPLALDFASSGSASPLPYIPLLNPFDIAQGVALIALLSLRSVHNFPSVPALSLWAFVWATAILLRSIHHYTGVPWEVHDLYSSIVIQTGLSIFWSSVALVLMWTAHAKRWREMWKAGAFLISVVVVKLFLIDLSGHNSGGRIIAFLGVGLLMLGIGYIAPIPPESENPKNAPRDEGR